MSSRSDAVFAPHQDVAARIIRQIEATRTRIDAAIFTVTFDRLTRALLAARQRGVAIRLLTDNDKALDLGSDIARLSHADLDVRIDRTEVHMHHKFAIFDEEWLLTGSYNWTRSAFLENQENLVSLRDKHAIAQFQTVFDALWSRWYDK